MIIHKVPAKYPADARVGGDVVLQALIGEHGTVQNLKVLTGYPILIPTAIKAAKQYKYRPFLIEGNPVEVDTEITISFTPPEKSR
jgi:protein TonB